MSMLIAMENVTTNGEEAELLKYVIVVVMR